MLVKQLGFCCALTVLAACPGITAKAEILGGNVSGGSTPGVFELLATPPRAAGPDAFQSPNLISFDEQQEVVLSAPLQLGPNLTFPIGSVISSHYVAFDPAIPLTVEGSILFDEPILAILGRATTLEATVGLLGASLTSYSTAPAIGPDSQSNDRVLIAPNNSNRLLFQAGANSPGDQFRVLTGVIPEPSTLMLAMTMSLSFCSLRIGN